MFLEGFRGKFVKATIAALTLILPLYANAVPIQTSIGAFEVTTMFTSIGDGFGPTTSVSEPSSVALLLTETLHTSCGDTPLTLAPNPSPIAPRAPS
jgi:hypothetical protein